MRKRYDDLVIQTDQNSKKFYNTILYSYIADSPNDIIYIVKEDDRLDLLAKKFYNDQTLWWVIARKNLLGKGTFYLEPGTRLTIPEKTLSNFILIDEV